MHNNDTFDCNVENSRGQETLSLGKCDDDDYDNDDGKALFGDNDDDDDDHHHNGELLFGSCFGSGWGGVAQWLRCCATNRKVADSIPAGVIGFFILPIALWPWDRLSL